MQAVREEPDVRRIIIMFAEGLVQRQERSAGVQRLIRDGLEVDMCMGRYTDMSTSRCGGMGTGRIRTAGDPRPDQ